MMYNLNSKKLQHSEAFHPFVRVVLGGVFYSP